MPKAEQDRPPKLEVELQFMGHYEEKNVKFQVDMNELAGCGSIIYEMTFDAASGEWQVIQKFNANRDEIGIEEFTQHKAPAQPQAAQPASPRNAGAQARVASPKRAASPKGASA